MREFIRAPDEEKRIEMARGFEAETGLPDIIGCIDGTLVNIQAPSDGEAAYVDRKGNHSINCQIVCDFNMWIWDVNALWPGSTHDQAVFNTSGLKRRFDSNEFGNYKLFGKVYHSFSSSPSRNSFRFFIMELTYTNNKHVILLLNNK